GMNPFNFSDSLLGVLAQRLVRCLCTKCRVPMEASEEMLLSLAREHGAAAPGNADDQHALIAAWRGQHGQDGRITLYRARGCAECSDTGYKGRIGLFELMPASSQIKRLIIGGTSAAPLFELAVKEGMQTLKQDGIRKVLNGTTELTQVLAVCER
ncbi:MAG TPA: pilus assembly protein PilB, partial [Gammaproteobacteria bacterium]|nr:pilus assembly protein PilB [Gammaproteobacteria bacterium]